MSFVLLAVLLAWISIIMVVVATCRCAARGDRAMSAEPRRQY